MSYAQIIFGIVGLALTGFGAWYLNSGLVAIGGAALTGLALYFSSAIPALTSAMDQVRRTHGPNH